MTGAPAYGSDVVVDLLRAVGVEHVALNPGATFRGLHDSLVNYAGGPALRRALRVVKDEGRPALVDVITRV